MSQFTPRFQSKPIRPQERGAEERLRLSPGAHRQEDAESVYRHQETRKIKSLSFWENTDQQAGEEEEWTERQSPTPFILAIIILVVASTLLWFLFQWASSENTNTPLIIPADTAPFKVRPENPGGMTIPHQDKLIYGRLSQNTPQPMERLLPPPEQPMAAPLQQPFEHAPPQQQQLGAPPPQQPYYPQGYPNSHPQQQGYVPPPQGYPHPPVQQGMPQQPPFQQGNVQPYASQAQAPYAQQQPLPNQPGYAPPLPPHGPTHQAYHGQSPYGPPAFIPPTGAMPPLAPPPQPALGSAPSKVSNIEDIKPASDEEDADDKPTNEGYDELNQLIAREAETPLRRSVKKDTRKPLKLTPLDPGKYKVQIASLPSRPMAENEMKRLRTHHGSIFENKPWNIQRIHLGSDRGSTHRLVVGSFPNHGAAAKFCKKLRSEKIGCLVVAPVNE